MHLIHVVGARPNFIKAAPVMAAIDHYDGVRQTLVHTGQHYDENMSRVFFHELGLPEPDVNLEVGSSSHAIQTAEIMKRFESVLLQERPDWVLVYGDVNSTVAAALVSTKLHIPVAHVEAGLRSFDRAMPEEINRVLTDQMAELLFTPSSDGDKNLLHEGVPQQKIHFVGNVMIDTLIRLEPMADARWPELRSERALGNYGLVTLHRPSNVEDPDTLKKILRALSSIAEDLLLIFPVHPRTRRRIAESEQTKLNPALQLIDPIGYIDFLALQKNAVLVITDSGGIQEESTFLGLPCLTVRLNTERPITLEQGTNVLVGQDMDLLQKEVQHILRGHPRTKSRPPLWDGKAGSRIAQILIEYKKTH